MSSENHESKVKKLTYSIPEAAEALGVSTTHMYQIIKIKGFPTLMVGKRILVSVKGLEEWVAEQAKKGWEGRYGE